MYKKQGYSFLVNIKALINNLSLLSRFYRTTAFILIDIFLIFLSYFITLLTFPGDNILFSVYLILFISLFLAIPIYFLLGQYRGISRYVGSQSLYSLLFRNLTFVISFSLISFSFKFNIFTNQGWVAFWILLTFLEGGFRFVLRDFLMFLKNLNNKQRKRVAIYGAGAAGAQLAATLKFGTKHNIITFIDDSPSLLNRKLNGIKINNLETFNFLDNKIDQILIAIPSASSSTRKKIINSLKQFELPVWEIPSIEEIASGNAKIDSIRAIDIEDLLCRDSAVPNKDLFGPNIKNATICITGAGGSIGSELSRQIITLKPKRLILFERNEPSLYLINEELKYAANKNIDLIPVLGSAKNKSLVNNIFMKYSVDIVFHAAAYKHVPLVESNPLEGIANNVFSTKVLCECSLICNVKKMILVSTDKAVRPTNVMGASKRMAELIIQGYSNRVQLDVNANAETKLSMVRFGNVLGSSGSVVPLFRKQIQNGGPITITHNKVIRYFMTITEAAQLVIQSSVLTEGGEVFLLDMGKPVKIYDLAEKMIKLSGMKIKNSSNPEGDIEIIYTGLRPGEKLFEELLIDAKTQSTTHPKILKATEHSLPYDYLINKVNEIEYNVNRQNKKKCIEIMSELIPEWKIYEETLLQ